MLEQSAVFNVDHPLAFGNAMGPGFISDAAATGRAAASAAKGAKGRSVGVASAAATATAAAASEVAARFTPRVPAPPSFPPMVNVSPNASGGVGLMNTPASSTEAHLKNAPIVAAAVHREAMTLAARLLARSAPIFGRLLMENAEHMWRSVAADASAASANASETENSAIGTGATAFSGGSGGGGEDMAQAGGVVSFPQIARQVKRNIEKYVSTVLFVSVSIRLRVSILPLATSLTFLCLFLHTCASQFPRRLRLRVSRSARASHCARFVDKLRRPRAVSAAAAAEVRFKMQRQKPLYSSLDYQLSANCVLFAKCVEDRVLTALFAPI